MSFNADRRDARLRAVREFVYPEHTSDRLQWRMQTYSISFRKVKEMRILMLWKGYSCGYCIAKTKHTMEKTQFDTV